MFVDSVEYPDLFQISPDGEVFSKRSNRCLHQVISQAGYCTIATKIGGRNGKDVLLRVHRMVANAFIPNPYDKPFVNHIDGVKHHNWVANLEWVSARENMRHAFREGLAVYTKCRLSYDDILYIRKYYTPGHAVYGGRALTRMFNVDRETIRKALGDDAYMHKVWIETPEEEWRTSDDW